MPDVEPVVPLELEIAQEHLAVAVLVEHRDLDRVQPVGRISSATNWPSSSTGTGRPAIQTVCCAGYAAAANRDRAAAERDVLERETVLAVGREQLGCRPRRSPTRSAGSRSQVVPGSPRSQLRRDGRRAGLGARADFRLRLYVRIEVAPSASKLVVAVPPAAA